ncbi:MAG: hypothetical protein R2736_02105 [Solirubrobacterales bacterium]
MGAVAEARQADGRARRLARGLLGRRAQRDDELVDLAAHLGRLGQAARDGLRGGDQRVGDLGDPAHARVGEGLHAAARLVEMARGVHLGLRADAPGVALGLHAHLHGPAGGCVLDLLAEGLGRAPRRGHDLLDARAHRRGRVAGRAGHLFVGRAHPAGAKVWDWSVPLWDSAGRRTGAVGLRAATCAST